MIKSIQHRSLPRVLPSSRPFAGGVTGVLLVLCLWRVSAVLTVNAASGGVIVAWGWNRDGQTTVPAGLSGVTAIAAGGYHTVALKSDGIVVAWGDNSSGHTTVPAGLSGVTAIAAGGDHTVALKGDGTVVAWGGNSSGQTTVPAGLSGVTAIAAGGYHTVALKGDGTVVAWGGNSYGQTTVPAGLSGVTAIAAGYYHTVALAPIRAPLILTQPESRTVSIGQGADFLTVLASGIPLPTYQWFKDGTPISGATEAVLSLGPAQAIHAGSYRVVASNAAGSVTSAPPAVLTVNAAYGGSGVIVAWGDNRYGQTTVPAGLSGVTAIAAGYAHTVALKTNGTVVAWGDNRSGQTTVPMGLGGVTAIAAGYAHTVALKTNGTVVAWGYNGSGQTTVPAGLSGVTAIAAGGVHTVALKGDGTVVAWGGNSYYGQTTVPAGLSGVTAIAAGGDHTVALKTNGTVVAWGWNGSGQTTVPAGLSGVTAIAAGGDHTVALKNNGTVVAWGQNTFGEATIPFGLNGVTAIAAGAGHTVALARFPTAIISGPGSVLRLRQFNLTAEATGDGPIFYEWQRAGVKISGATNASLAWGGELALGAVTYSVVVSNAYGSSVASVSINVVNAFRRLPSGYWPQVPFVVEIEYAPRQGVLTHAIVDNLPTGSMTQLVPELYNQAGVPIAYKVGAATVSLQPTAINEGGSWDSSTATVKWGPFFDDTPRVLRYTITPPAGWSVPIALSGRLSEDGVSSPLPSQTLAIYPLHPADNALPANNFIRAFEMSSYATAWKRGLLWPVGSNPINVDYMTQAGVIWRRGEYYEYVGGAGPQCWQPAALPAGVVPQSLESGVPLKSGGSARSLAKSILPEGMSAAGTAVRTMPSVVNPAAPFDVSLTITPDASTTVQLFEEQLPSGWQAVNITAGGSVDTNFNKVKWGPFFDATTRTLTYTVVPPAGTNGTFTLSGLAGFDGNVITISGQSNVALGPIPTIIAHPQSRTVVAGSDVSLTVTATGSAPLSYQWRKDGLDLAGQSTSTLALTNVIRAQSALYSVVVSNAIGTATSSNALLRVLVPQRLQSPQRLADGRFRILFGDQDGGLLSLGDLASFEIDVSTNLVSTNWIRFTNGFTLTNGMILLNDAAATNYPIRFYRVIER